MRFSKNEQDFFKNIDKLPIELVDVISTYIPTSVKMFLTKHDYEENHFLIRQFIGKRNIEQYIRTMVRDDNDYVFKHLLVENKNRWLNMKKYYYKECIYANYMYFLQSFAIDNESSKCQTVLHKLFEEEGLNKNQHKKNIIRNIKWRV